MSALDRFVGAISMLGEFIIVPFSPTLWAQHLLTLLCFLFSWSVASSITMLATHRLWLITKSFVSSSEPRRLAALFTPQRAVFENNTQLGHLVILYLLLYPLFRPGHSSVLSLQR